MAPERTDVSTWQYSPYATMSMIWMLKVLENFKDQNGEAVVPSWCGQCPEPVGFPLLCTPLSSKHIFYSSKYSLTGPAALALSMV